MLNSDKVVESLDKSQAVHSDLGLPCFKPDIFLITYAVDTTFRIGICIPVNLLFVFRREATTNSAGKLRYNYDLLHITLSVRSHKSVHKS